MGWDLVEGEWVMCYPVRCLSMVMLQNVIFFVRDETKWIVYVMLDLRLVADFST